MNHGDNAATKLPCPVCGEPTHVTDTRRNMDRITRRRQCLNNHRFRTSEYFLGKAWTTDGTSRIPLDLDDQKAYDGRTAEMG